MYTKKMHERIRKITQKYYDQQIHTEQGFSLGREMTFSDIDDLLNQIEELNGKIILIKLDTE